MLVFKKNIYEQPSACHPENVTQQNLNAHDFIFRSLTADREIFYGLQQLPEQEGQNHFKIYFPTHQDLELFLSSIPFPEPS